jgi:cell division protein FtsL
MSDTEPEDQQQEDAPQSQPESEEESVSFVQEFISFLKEEKIWWITPLIIVLVLVAAILIMNRNTENVAPFLYNAP